MITGFQSHKNTTLQTYLTTESTDNIRADLSTLKLINAVIYLVSLHVSVQTVADQCNRSASPEQTGKIIDPS